MNQSTMHSKGTVSSIKKSLFLTLLVVLAGVVTLTGCRQPAQDTQDIGERGGFEVRNASDCLPDITLVDQNGRNVSLASLKGKPVLFDFIYTTCPGPCTAATLCRSRQPGRIREHDLRYHRLRAVESGRNAPSHRRSVLAFP